MNKATEKLNVKELKNELKQEWSRIKNDFDVLEEDLQKFIEKGNSAAGTRFRQGLQEIKKKAQTLRIGVQDIKSNK